MKTLFERLKEADALLAPYAVQHTNGLGRVHSEEDDTLRFRFQRDRGRIVHTEAFRRLKGKTQVFVGGGGDHYRTRLTHTMEVAGISRDMARALSVNEDLAECIALAHDIGHPPFGHAGEATLSYWLEQYGSSFEHNIQSYRIITVLERHCHEYPGLNLNSEVLEGLLKHSDDADGNEPKRTQAPSIEAQLVNIADEIAYTAHDCEDGLQSQLLDIDALHEVELAQSAFAIAQPRGTSLRGALIRLLVEDLIEHSHALVAKSGVESLTDVYTAKEPLVRFSDAMREQINALHRFLEKHMYNHSLVLQRAEAGQTIVELLCSHFLENPNEKIEHMLKHASGDTHRAVVDYVSGMTDSYAFRIASEEGLINERLAEMLGQ